jgi:type I restriction enzyme R subunit
MRLAETFNEMYPQYEGKLVQVIDSKMERADKLLNKFKKENLPRIAISVDMLDTGVDIPEIVNLAFMKPVNSNIKFWQMIGRGTRNNESCKHFDWLPDGMKERFLIVDYWENFETIRKDDTNKQIPILVTIFNYRLSKILLLLGEQNSEDAKRIIADIRNYIGLIPLESFSVKKVFKEVKEAWDDEFWSYITPNKIEFLKLKVAPLLRFVSGVNADEAFFTNKMEKCGLLFLKKNNMQSNIQSIKEDVSLLPTNLSQISEHIVHVNEILSNEFWKSITLAKIDEKKVVLAPLMKYKREKPSLIFELGLDDFIEARKWVVVRKENEKVYVEEYRKRIEARILELADKHPAIIKLKQGKELNIDDMLDLELTLSKELNADEFSLDDKNMLKAYGVKVGSFIDFLKHVLKLETLPTYETIIRKAFDFYILEHNYNADQSRFLRAVQNFYIQHHKLEPADLYEEPFINFGVNAVEKLFSEEEVNELVELTKKLVA